MAERKEKNRKAETMKSRAEHAQSGRGGHHAPAIEESGQFLGQENGPVALDLVTQTVPYHESCAERKRATSIKKGVDGAFDGGKIFLSAMNRTTLKTAMLLSGLFGLAACAAQRPVLYSNEQLMRVGPTVGERDIDECMRRAEGYGSSEHGPDVGESAATDTVTSAAAGAAGGGAGGAVIGQAGRGAAAGAAGGAAAGLTAGLLRGLFAPRQPSPSLPQRDFVNRCLREKGYEPGAWK